MPKAEQKEAKAEAVEPKEQPVSTDALVEKEWNFPREGVTIKAHSLEDALKKLNAKSKSNEQTL